MCAVRHVGNHAPGSGHGRAVRRTRVSSEAHVRGPVGREGTVAQISGLSGSANPPGRALRPDVRFGGLGAKERWWRFVIQALAGQEFGTTAGRKPGFFGAAGTKRVGLWKGCRPRLRSLRGRHGTRHSGRCRTSEARWTTYRPGVRPTRGATRSRMSVRVLDRSRRAQAARVGIRRV